MGRKGTGVEARERSIRVQFTLNGETVRETLTKGGKPLPPTPANLKYAARLVADVKRAVDNGTFDFAEFFPGSPRAAKEPAAPQRFGDLADAWLQSKGALSAATKAQYASAVNRWKVLLGEDTDVKALTHKVLVAKLGGHPWPSPKTHNNYLIALRGIMALEYRGADAANNPTNGIDNLRTVKRLPDPLLADERDRILADMQARYPVQVYAYFLWQFSTGMRPEETIALRWSDVDAARQTIRVQRVRTFRGSERDGTKTGVVRDVDLTPPAAEALRLMKPFTSMLRVEREKDDDTSADIFQRPSWQPAKGSKGGRPSDAGPWNNEREQRDTYWRPSLKRLAIRWRPPYNTRHTFATVALMAGVPPGYIADQLGHSVKILLERYARWTPGGDGGGARALLAAALGQSKTLTGT